MATFQKKRSLRKAGNGRKLLGWALLNANTVGNVLLLVLAAAVICAGLRP